MTQSLIKKIQPVIAILLVMATWWLLQQRFPLEIEEGISELPGLQATVFDYSTITDIKEKKQLFFDTLRPIVLQENQKIQTLRNRLLALQPAERNKKWVLQVAKRFGIDDYNSRRDWSELLKRVDIIPLDLALAQAAMESAWGESRFAQQGNNLFGQWCFTKGCGIVPQQRAEGASHEVRKFASINKALIAYMHNINTGHAYDILRTLRARLRFRNKPVDGDTLAGGLVRYSERGSYYVMEIRQVMRVNRQLIFGQAS